MLHHFFPSFSCLGIAIFGWGAYSFHNFDSLVISSIPAINIYQALAVCLAVFWVQMMWPILGNQRRTFFFLMCHLSRDQDDKSDYPYDSLEKKSKGFVLGQGGDWNVFVGGKTETELGHNE